MEILVTGATGFIGSHTCVELINSGYDIVGIDNFINSKPEALDSIEKITGKRIAFYEGDVCDEKLLRKIMTEHKITAAIHFAGLKAVGESVEKPLMYYQNNLLSTIILAKVMNEFGCKKIIFSSSATVYGNPHIVPITENFPVGEITNPYGATKLMCEDILKDLQHAEPDWGVCLLRYFNPIGAHESGLIGEEPNGIPNNLMPYIVKVASKQLPQLNVFGNDYPTYDGTGVRDYLHVVDLAKGHVCALKKLLGETGVLIYNLGTGKGSSVLDLVETFKKVNNIEVPYVIAPRRAGDIPECYANADKAFKELGWRAEKNVEDMCRDSWNYYLKHKQESVNSIFKAIGL